MPLTKQDIDALVDGMQSYDGILDIDWEGCVSSIPVKDMRRTLYLAAGLSATGERKPERVRCHLYQYDDGRPMLLSFEPIYGTSYYQHHPGWFVPDGAE